MLLTVARNEKENLLKIAVAFNPETVSNDDSTDCPDIMPLLRETLATVTFCLYGVRLRLSGGI